MFLHFKSVLCCFEKVNFVFRDLSKNHKIFLKVVQDFTHLLTPENIHVTRLFLFFFYQLKLRENHLKICLLLKLEWYFRLGVMVIILGNRIGEPSSNSNWGCLQLIFPNTFEKDMNPSILPPAIDERYGWSEGITSNEIRVSCVYYQ